jgi:hypothetical protein
LILICYLQVTQERQKQKKMAEEAELMLSDSEDSEMISSNKAKAKRRKIDLNAALVQDMGQRKGMKIIGL